jgi:hypothetical protein
VLRNIFEFCKDKVINLGIVMSPNVFRRVEKVGAHDRLDMWLRQTICNEEICIGTSQLDSLDEVNRYQQALKGGCSHISIGKKSSADKSGDLGGQTNSSARHRVIKVIPHLVYQVKTNDLRQLKARIRDTVAIVIYNILHNRWTDVEYSLDICFAIRGVHIEIWEGG